MEELGCCICQKGRSWVGLINRKEKGKEEEEEGDPRIGERDLRKKKGTGMRIRDAIA